MTLPPPNLTPGDAVFLINGRSGWSVHVKKKSKKPKEQKRSEHVEQREFVAWFRRTYPSVRIIAIPNGGARHPVVAAKLKLEGVTPGVPDLFVPAWGLWIEMKAIGGKESEAQKDWREYLENVCKFQSVVCVGFESAKEFTLNHVKVFGYAK